MILRSLRLRGAIGIRNGLSKDDITIDFTKFGSGLIAVTGPNGAGKTTIIENLSPYPFLKSRTGSLARQFFLKDSCRDLLISMNGDEFRFLININAISGKMERLVYKNGEALNPDGKEATYNEIVNRLFGEPALYFASLFMAQHRQRFSDLPPVESKTLLLKLIGADRLQAKCDYAGAQGKTLADQIGRLDSALQVKIEDLGDFAGIDDDITAKTKAIGETFSEYELAGINIESLLAEVQKLQAIVTDQAVTESKVQLARTRLNEILRERSSVDVSGRRKIDDLRTSILGDKVNLDRLKSTHTPERLQAIEARIAEAEHVKNEYLGTVEDSRRYSELSVRLADARRDYSHAKATHEGEGARLKAEHTLAINELGSAQARQKSQIERLEGDVERKQRAIQILSTVPCQSSAADVAESCKTCEFLQDALRAKDVLESAEKALSQVRTDAESESAALTNAVTEARNAQQTFGEWTGSADEVRLRSEGESTKTEMDGMGFDAAAAATLRLRHEAFERENPAGARVQWDAQEREIETLTVRVNENTQRLDEAKKDQTEKLDELTKQFEALDIDTKGLEASIDPLATSKLSMAKVMLDKKRADEKSLSEELVRLRTDLDRLQADKQKAEDLAAEIETDRTALAEIQTHQADWNHLAQSLSRNGGFQSILVESAGAEMSPYADTMLALYGRSWTMEFATVRPSDDGKKMIEGFYITINTPDGPRELSALSGGEEVIADQVIYDAIGNMLRRRSGLDLRTAIKDEADGALDSQRAIDYLRAVEAGHQASGLFHTIIISHRPELQDMIAQKIRLVPGTGIVTEVG